MPPRRRLTAPRSRRLQRLGLRLAGAGLLAATGTIHLDLYLTGYRSIPTIGWLFLFQVSAVFSVAAAVLATGSRLLAAAGATLALATLGGYLQSVWIGLFGFNEIRSTAGMAAGIVEVAAFAALAARAAGPAAPGQPASQANGGSRPLARPRAVLKWRASEPERLVGAAGAGGGGPRPWLARSGLASRGPSASGRAWVVQEFIDR